MPQTRAWVCGKEEEQRTKEMPRERGLHMAAHADPAFCGQPHADPGSVQTFNSVGQAAAETNITAVDGITVRICLLGCQQACTCMHTLI